MYDDTGGSNPKRLLIILLVALIVVIGGTILLNGQTSTEFEDNTTDENVTNETPEVNPINSTVLGNTTWGTVTKMGPYGNASSDTKIAYVLGVNQNSVSNNSIVPSLESQNELKYAYYIYLIDVSNSQNNNDNTNSSSNMSVNDKSQLLAKEFATPDIINNKYDCCVDIHSTNDSNSYVFVPSENTYTSKIVAESISNSTNVGQYTPDKHAYTEAISEQIIKYEIPSIVYVTKEYYAGNTSSEISSVIHALDNFDFVQLFSPSANVSEAESSNVSSSNNVENNTVIVSSNSSGNKEVN